MDTSTIVCISAYAIGLVVFPVLFEIVNSRLVVSDFLGDDDYIIFFTLLVLWPLVVSIAILMGIGYVVCIVPFGLMKRVVKWSAEKRNNLRLRKRFN